MRINLIRMYFCPTSQNTFSEVVILPAVTFAWNKNVSKEHLPVVGFIPTALGLFTARVLDVDVRTSAPSTTQTTAWHYQYIDTRTPSNKQKKKKTDKQANQTPQKMATKGEFPKIDRSSTDTWDSEHNTLTNIKTEGCNDYHGNSRRQEV